MREEIEHRLAELEEAKTNALRYFEGLTSEQTARRMGDEWSMIQVIEHILLSETGTLGYMMKKTSGGFDVLEKVSDQEKNAGEALVQRLRSGERYKAPSVLPEPEGHTSLEELAMKWNSLREKMKSFVLSVPEEHYDKLIFRQPAAGMITLHDTLRFLITHIRHHYPQLERIKSRA